MTLRTYELEDDKRQMFGKRQLYLAQGDGLFSFGFPSLHQINRGPQGTLYMDGNVYILRSTKGHARKDLELSASFKDGLSLCFFREENTTISLQLSTPTGITIEMNSHGLIYMLRTQNTHKSLILVDYKVEDKKQNMIQLDGLHEKARPCAMLANVQDINYGKEENWRCILPHGIVISNKSEGDFVAMFPNGNVSERKCCQLGWMTTNSRGYHVLEVPEVPPPTHSPAPPLCAEPAHKEGNIEGEDKPSKAAAKHKKKENAGDTVAGKKKKATPVETTATGGGQGNNASDVVTAPAKKERSPYEGLIKVACVEDASKPSLYLLPKRRVVQISDMQMGCRIESREDLVTTVQTNKDELIVYHSDGTSIYTTGGPGPCLNTLQSEDSNSTNVEGRQDVGECDERQRKGSMVWQVEKEGYPTVYSDARHTMLDIACSDQNFYYRLRWCKASGEIHVSVPQGKCICTKGNSVILDASRDGHTPMNSVAADHVQDLDIWEHSHVASNSQHSHGLYVFNLENGTISHEDCTGHGFQVSKSGVFQRNSIKSHSKDPKHRKQPLNAQQLVVDLQSASKDKQPTRKPARKKRPNPRDKHLISAFKLIDKFRKRKSTGCILRGPSTRIFVFHEGGRGYEILSEQCFQRQLEDSHVMHLSEEINKNEYGTILLHTLVKRCLSLPFHGEEDSMDILPSTYRVDWASNILSESGKCSHLRKHLMPVSYDLPPVLKKTPLQNIRKLGRTAPICYRQVREYCSLNEEQRKNVEQKLENLAYWELDLLFSLKDGKTYKKLLEATEAEACEVTKCSCFCKKQLNWSRFDSI